MNKTLSKAFMHRTRLKNEYNNLPSEENHSLYRKQRNYCTHLLKREKNNYYNSLDLILIEKGETICDENIVAEKMNNYFIDVIEELDIEPFSGTEEEPVN